MEPAGTGAGLFLDWRQTGGGIAMSATSSTAVPSTTVPSAWYWNRWNQLVLGLIAMMAISSPQYVWTLFTGPLNQKLGTTLAELQWTFSLLIILQTWCSPA
jgi:OFA family oxalate/formate antiporter-like MFS transporter